MVGKSICMLVNSLPPVEAIIDALGGANIFHAPQNIMERSFYPNSVP